MEDKEQESYKYIQPLSYQDIVDDWTKNCKEWYHVIVTSVDIPIILAIPNLKIYAWREVIVDSQSNFDWHGLVHFPNRKMRSWKMQCRRIGMGSPSAKTRFKKVICLDQIVEVLHHIACTSELDNGDGLATHPNMHGTRKCIDSFHRHDKGLECSNVRKDISTKLSNLFDFSAKSNWTDDGLHNKKMCLCSSGGRIGKEKRGIASGKHHACYKVEADSEAKKRCRKKV